MKAHVTKLFQGLNKIMNIWDEVVNSTVHVFRIQCTFTNSTSYVTSLCQAVGPSMHEIQDFRFPTPCTLNGWNVKAKCRYTQHPKILKPPPSPTYTVSKSHVWPQSQYLSPENFYQWEILVEVKLEQTLRKAIATCTTGYFWDTFL
jgi:hypothetical protein